MRFLNALTRAAQRVKAEGRKVIIAGDLNIAYRGQDMCHIYRRVHLPSILEGRVPNLPSHITSKLQAASSTIMHMLKVTSYVMNLSTTPKWNAIW